MKLERGQLVIGSARWRTIEEESRNILLAIVRYRNGSIWWWFHGAMRPRSSFMAYSRIPPAVLLRFPRHLAPTLALNLPLTASLVNRPDSRPGAVHETTRMFSMDPWRSLRKYRNHWRKILVRQAMKWKIVIEVCSSLNCDRVVRISLRNFVPPFVFKKGKLHLLAYFVDSMPLSNNNPSVYLERSSLVL